MTVFRYLILINIDFLRLYFSVLSLVLVWIAKIYQALKTSSEHISKQLKIRQNYSTARRIFNSWFFEMW